MKFRRTAVFLTPVLLLVGSTVHTQAQKTAEAECFEIVNPLFWMSSAAWTHDGRSLIMIDPLRPHVLIYRPEAGESTVQGKEITQQILGGEHVSVTRPSIIRSNYPDDGFLIEDEADGTIVRLNNDLHAVSEHKVLDMLDESSRELRALYDWTARGDLILGFGDIKKPDGSWTSGFVEFVLGDSNFSLLKEVPLSDVARDLYIIQRSYTAIIDQTSVFLVKDQEYSLQVVNSLPAGSVAEKKSASSIRLIKGAYATRPTLSPKQGPGSISLLFEQLSEHASIESLLEWEGKTYLLSRIVEPNPKRISWRLSSIDPRSGAVGKFIELPSASPHLAVIPGPEHWAVVNKGEVFDVGVQSLGPLCLISSQKVRGYFQ